MTGPSESALRRQIIDTCQGMNRLGVNQGKAGNVSVRLDDGLLITPSGMDYDSMTPADIVFLDADGKPHGDRKPSSEWRFHYDILRSRMDVDAILHAHPISCTALACLGRASRS